jgi:hypothetical protein
MHNYEQKEALSFCFLVITALDITLVGWLSLKNNGNISL